MWWNMFIDNKSNLNYNLPVFTVALFAYIKIKSYVVEIFIE